MDIGLAIGLGAASALAASALREENGYSGALGCKCRAKMDATFEDDSSPSIGCGMHVSYDEEDEEIRLRGRGSSLPGSRPFKAGPFGMGSTIGPVAIAARKPYVARRPRLSGDGPVPPGYNCQATQEGGVICSDGTGFPPGCPKCPAPNYPGVAEKRVVGSQIIDVPPPWPEGSPYATPGAVTTAAPASVGGIPIVPLAIGGGLLALLLLS